MQGSHCLCKQQLRISIRSSIAVTWTSRWRARGASTAAGSIPTTSASLPRSTSRGSCDSPFSAPKIIFVLF